MQFLAPEVSTDYYTHLPGIVSLLMLTIQTYGQSPYIYIYIYTQGRFNNYTVHILYRIIITATSVVGVMKMGNVVSRAGIEPTSMAFWASVLPHHVASLMSQL